MIKEFKNVLTEEIVKALQFTYINIDECKKFVGDKWVEDYSNLGTLGCFIEISKGNTTLLSNKDWIVKVPEGHIFKNPDYLFKQLYQEI